MNDPVKRCVVVCGILGCLVSATTCLGLVILTQGGTWPKDWPAELDPYRQRAETADVAHGIQETIYYIPLKSRAEFESIWPALLRVKSPQAPVVLYSLDQDAGPRSLGPVANDVPCVRIIAPPGGTTDVAAPPLPMPASWQDPFGEGAAVLQAATPPEYIVRIGKRQIAVSPGDATARSRFIYRARTDLELVVDGEVIDWSRIRIPAGTPVIDRRVVSPQTAPSTQPAAGKP